MDRIRDPNLIVIVGDSALLHAVIAVVAVLP